MTAIEIQEPFPVTDIFCTGLARVEHLGPCRRLVFYVVDTGYARAVEHHVVSNWYFQPRSWKPLRLRSCKTNPPSSTPPNAERRTDRATWTRRGASVPRSMLSAFIRSMF